MPARPGSGRGSRPRPASGALASATSRGSDGRGSSARSAFSTVDDVRRRLDAVEVELVDLLDVVEHLRELLGACVRPRRRSARGGRGGRRGGPGRGSASSGRSLGRGAHPGLRRRDVRARARRRSASHAGEARTAPARPIQAPYSTATSAIRARLVEQPEQHEQDGEERSAQLGDHGKRPARRALRAPEHGDARSRASASSAEQDVERPRTPPRRSGSAPLGVGVRTTAANSDDEQRRAPPVGGEPVRRRAAAQSCRPVARASSVLRSSIAIVIGPTPPGTGVISRARSARGRRTRRRRPGPSSVRLMPTSITTAPALTQSPRTSSGTPDGGDEHVGAAADRGEVARARVADRDGRVGGEQQRARPACRRGPSGRPRPPRRPRARRRGGAAAPSRRAACTGAGPAGPWPAGRRRPASARRRPCSARSARSARRRRPAAASGAGAGCPRRAGSALSSCSSCVDLVVRRVLRRAGGRSPRMPTSALAFCLPPT